jgi:putative flavoprotein involved in K+ transport
VTSPHPTAPGNPTRTAKVEVVREGQVIHRRGVTQVPGLYLLGLSWQHTRGSALLGFVNDDAVYLADRIATRHQAAVSATVPATQEPSS